MLVVYVINSHFITEPIGIFLSFRGPKQTKKQTSETVQVGTIIPWPYFPSPSQAPSNRLSHRIPIFYLFSTMLPILGIWLLKKCHYYNSRIIKGLFCRKTNHTRHRLTTVRHKSFQYVLHVFPVRQFIRRVVFQDDWQNWKQKESKVLDTHTTQYLGFNLVINHLE